MRWARAGCAPKAPRQCGVESMSRKGSRSGPSKCCNGRGGFGELGRSVGGYAQARGLSSCAVGRRFGRAHTPRPVRRSLIAGRRAARPRVPGWSWASAWEPRSAWATGCSGSLRGQEPLAAVSTRGLEGACVWLPGGWAASGARVSALCGTGRSVVSWWRVRAVWRAFPVTKRGVARWCCGRC